MGYDIGNTLSTDETTQSPKAQQSLTIHGFIYCAVLSWPLCVK